MMPQNLRTALAVTLLALAAVWALNSAPAGTAIEYGLMYDGP